MALKKTLPRSRWGKPRFWYLNEQNKQKRLVTASAPSSDIPANAIYHDGEPVELGEKLAAQAEMGWTDEQTDALFGI